jgi:hypothetical protein
LAQLKWHLSFLALRFPFFPHHCFSTIVRFFFPSVPIELGWYFYYNIYHIILCGCTDKDYLVERKRN